MTDGNLAVIGCQARGEGRGRVAVDEDQVRGSLGENLVQTLDQPRCEPCQILSRPHDIEIDVGLDLEEGEHLVEHLAMLRGDDYRRPKGRFRECVGTQFMDDRGHLDRFGPCAKNQRVFAFATMGDWFSFHGRRTAHS